MLVGKNCLVGIRWRDKDVNIERMSAAACHDAFDGAHIVEIASPTDGNVFFAHVHVVGRIQVHPTERRDEYGKPCVRGVSADHGRFIVFIGANVSADVPCGQAQRTQTGDA